jgi:hypothetical protein
MTHLSEKKSVGDCNDHIDCLLTCQGHGFPRDHPSVVLPYQLVLENIPAQEVVVVVVVVVDLCPFETLEEVPLLGHPVHFLL